MDQYVSLDDMKMDDEKMSSAFDTHFRRNGDTNNIRNHQDFLLEQLWSYNRIDSGSSSHINREVQQQPQYFSVNNENEDATAALVPYIGRYEQDLGLLPFKSTPSGKLVSVEYGTVFQFDSPVVFMVDVNSNKQIPVEFVTDDSDLLNSNAILDAHDVIMGSLPSNTDEVYALLVRQEQFQGMESQIHVVSHLG